MGGLGAVPVQGVRPHGSPSIGLYESLVRTECSVLRQISRGHVCCLPGLLSLRGSLSARGSVSSHDLPSRQCDGHARVPDGDVSNPRDTMAMGDGGMNCRGSNNRASLDAAVAFSLLFEALRRRAGEPER